MKTDCTDPETLRALLGEKRAAHVLGTARLAEELAALYGADAEKARTAALLHDRFRGASDAELDARIDRYGLPPALKGNANLSHGRIAAAWMERELGIADAELLDAVRYHTTGRADMSKLEKILYVADAAEPTREHEGLAALREAARRDLDEACLTALENTLRHLRKKGIRPDADSLRARDRFADLCARRGADGARPEGLKRERGNRLDSKELALGAAEALRQKKGSDIVILDIAEKSSFADFLVIATGNSVRQVGSLADDAEKALSACGATLGHIEGKPESGWVLLDYGDVIVNVFTKGQRDLYRIEQIWGDGSRIEPQEV
ncbi:MAG: bis(5'-nucleosyl)-tetraphosphatase (symmetrical) YqeK [Clostridiales Family XIII bacterium]|jgi:ribosome silencing factor RsfS/YbeB/iojap|nr:bis(5'-nucleosyl)-tetraphosphatase (symmetrical) YqeK [Clostridiales Family XIII bacterium]